MKILLWHGYLLGGTGSNVYTRALAKAWAALGHEVVVFSQDPHPERFVEQNAAVVREHLPADFLLTNHVLLGAPVGAAVGMPFTVKAHGSELEFAMRGNDDLCAWARESLPKATEVLAGSEHVRTVLEEVVGWTERVRVVPPGVDVEELRPEPRGQALAALIEESRRDGPPSSERDPDAGNAGRFAEFLAGEAPTVIYVGKLSEEKGVHLLLEALRGVDARAVVVGFGPARDELERAAEGEVLFTGALEHRHLRHLWPLADVSVTPSIFPEAFGMVAAESAACGCPPLVARQSGLAEVAESLEAAYPVSRRDIAGFRSGDAADLALKLQALLSLPHEEWAELSSTARAVAVERWSWESIAALILSPRG